MSKLITVFGATGAQGGPVARALLSAGFKVRAVTRSADSDKAKALQEAGAEVFAGTITDKESVRSAVAGAYGVFIVTLVSPNETEVGKAAADVCKSAGLKHVVFSGLPPVKSKIGKGCQHFDCKAAVEDYLDEIGVPNTSVRYPFYFDNFASFIIPFKKESDGTFTITMPMDGPIHTMSVADAAPIVAEVFKHPERYMGKKLALSAGAITVDEHSKIISEVTEKTLRYNQISFEEAASDPANPYASEMSSMYEFYSKAEMPYDEEFTRSINPGALTFRQWAEKNKDLLIKKMEAL